MDLVDYNPFCHGTSTKFLHKIRKHGLRPRNADKTCVRESCWVGSSESRNDRVYLGSIKHGRGYSLCEAAAKNAVYQFGGREVILAVTLPKKMQKLAKADEDCEEYEGTRDWRKCLQLRGTIAIKGAIPPQCIEVLR